MTTPPLLRVLAGERLDPPPVWMMRQAGRYLPEYRALRAEKGGFLALATDPQAAAEVTLQPLRRFGLDGAILFSDILTVPWALGQDLWFEAGEGPRLAPPLDEGQLDALTPQHDRLDPVYAAVRACVAGLEREGFGATAMLGFAGSPWTVATYMVAGQGSKDQAAARALAWARPERFGRLIDAIVALTAEYLLGQIEAGAQAVQLFDSWAGSLSPDQFDRWVIAPNRAIVERVHASAPGVPVIGFPKGAGAKLPRYAREVGADAIGLDETLDPDWAHESPAPPPAGAGQSRPHAAAGGRETRWTRAWRASAGRSATGRTSSTWATASRSTRRWPMWSGCWRRRARPSKGSPMTGYLGDLYLWAKAAHLIFVIYWIAGLFLLPRYYIYHQEAGVGTAEAERWVDREGKLRRIILTPSMIIVWVLGIALALNWGIVVGGRAGSGRLAAHQDPAGDRPDRLPRLADRLWPQAGRRHRARVRQDAAPAERGARRRGGGDRGAGHREAVLT